MERSPVHLPGLNGIRAIAAFLVLTLHVDVFSPYFGLKPIGIGTNGSAKYPVILFFVLSGYLITYLLADEKASHGHVSVGKFYARRALRIWPLYYLLLIVAAVLVATGALTTVRDAGTTFLFWGLLLPNVGAVLDYNIFPLSPFWSIGVEEQCYLIWPTVINRSRSVARGLLVVFLAWGALKLLLRLTEDGVAYSVARESPYGCVLIGGLAAALVRMPSPRLRRFLFAPATQAFAWLAFAYGMIKAPLHAFTVFDFELNAIVYAVIIVNVSANPRTLISLEQRVFDYVGRRSYGLYMLHFPWLALMAFLVRDVAHVSMPLTAAGYAAYYGIAAGGAIVLAAASYRWVELPFLRQKRAFAVIETAA
jgi:peptidoglycan/LPS O-acetylase OafA/YrhL